MKKVRSYMSRIFSVVCCLAMLTAMLATTSCSDDPNTEESYIRFGDEFTALTYSQAGGSKTIEMYSNVGYWRIQPEFAEDMEWIDVWPREGTDNARFTVKTAKNETAYTRYAKINVVAGGTVVKSFSIEQGATDPVLKLDMGSNQLSAASRGGDLTISLETNIGWKAEAINGAEEWITIADATDLSQVIKIGQNAGDERIGEVRIKALGTGLENLETSVFIKQFDTTNDPYNGTHKTIKQLLDELGTNGGSINSNVYVEGYVINDRKMLNTPKNQTFIQDESGRGMCLEFASVRDNDLDLNTKVKVHLYGTEAVIDPVTKGLKFPSITSAAIFERTASDAGIAPVEVERIADLDNYENTLVTLKRVEFAVPMGTYVNIDESKYTITPPNINATEYNDGVTTYGHMLRDQFGGSVKLYSDQTFLDRFAAVIPVGSGEVTGIVMKRTKAGVTSNTLKMRSAKDNKVSDSPTTRFSKTHVQFGPFTNLNSLAKITPVIGSGQLKTTMWENIGMTGGVAMNYGWSYARRETATIKVDAMGNQTPYPILSNAQTGDVGIKMQFTCISCQYFWDFTGSTMNREGADPEYKGEAWVFNVDNFAPGSGQLDLWFSFASSQTGPLYFNIEWADNEGDPISSYHEFGQFYSPDWASCYQLQHFVFKLPEELRSRSKFTIRFRVLENLRASNDGQTIWTGGSPRVAFWAITER